MAVGISLVSCDEKARGSKALTAPRFAKEESLKEIHRVLKPGAKLGLVWNVEDCEEPFHPTPKSLLLILDADNSPESWPASTRWEQQLRQLSFSGHLDGQPRFRHLEWQDVFERQAAGAQGPLFSTPPGTEKATWSVWLTRGGLWDRVNTLSWNAVRKGEARRGFEERFDEILGDGDGTRNERGEVEVHGCTFFAWTERL